MTKAKSITGLKRHVPTGVNARIIALTRLEELYSWVAYVDDPYNIYELHNLRIAVKRLRYTLEIFADVLPEACGSLRKEVEQVQEELGAMHDSDVMVALLRLCLGSQDSGSGYMYLLARAAQLRAKGNYVVNPELMAHLLDPEVVPSAEQRRGLELLLSDLQKRREEQYIAFRQHWHQLEYRNFRNQLFAALHL
jgi:hypothetical protein